MNRSHRAVWAVVLVAAIVGLSPALAADYVGHDASRPCHSAIYDDYTQSGHPYKLNKVEDGQSPSYAHSEVPSPPDGYTWDDITYVIGGFNWKARFLDSEGYIITGDAVQYNLATQGWVGYHSDEAPGTKPYDCGKCHTTGWQTTEENGGQTQDDLPGMAGTFSEPGVRCEGCHGPGGDHVAAPKADNISRDTSKEMCGSCHFRDGGHRIAASSGLIKHHEQYDELINSPHRFMDCGQCHAPHESTVYDLGGVTEGSDCTQCHASQTVQVAAMADHSCESCHMPLASKSAVVSAEFGDTGILGDIQSHTFKLNTDPSAAMFTEDGKFVALDDEGDAVVRVEFACGGCHNGTVAPNQSVDWMYANARIVHEECGPAAKPTCGATAVAEVAGVQPKAFAVSDAWPNPFNPVTHVRYDLPSDGFVRAEVYDVRGALVRTVVDEHQQAGRYLATWLGVADDGTEAASGAYFLRLQAGELTETVRMTLVR